MLPITWSWCLWGSEPFCLGWWLEKLMLPALIAFLVYSFAVAQLRKKRSIDFADKQLTEFYGPMIAARAEIFNHTMFDRYMRAASRHADAAKLKLEKNRKVDAEYVNESNAYGEELGKFFETLNTRLYNETIESYISMRKLFAAKMVYADADTQGWYDYFYAFVEMWKVMRDDDNDTFLPHGVGALIGMMFDEELLQPFYAHLNERGAYLQAEIAGRKTAKKPAPTPPSTETLELLHRATKDEMYIP